MRRASCRLALALLIVAAFWAALLWGLSQLSTAWQAFALLAYLLHDLLRMIGDRKYVDHRSRMVYGPLTLAAPLQPWQQSQPVGLTDIEEDF